MGDGDSVGSFAGRQLLFLCVVVGEQQSEQRLLVCAEAAGNQPMPPCIVSRLPDRDGQPVHQHVSTISGRQTSL